MRAECLRRIDEQICSRGMAPQVEGFVNGAISDFVFYRLVDKN